MSIMTLRDLTHRYQTDESSPYQAVRYATRTVYGLFCRRILADHGDEKIVGIRTRHILEWHQNWAAEGRAKLAFSLCDALSRMALYGATSLKDEKCEGLVGAVACAGLRRDRASHTEGLTTDQVRDLRVEAHLQGRHSLAIAQAIRHDLKFRQKDTIGEWVPVGEPGWSDIVHDGRKWLRGVRWDEIDDLLVLRHRMCRTQKLKEVDLRTAPMIMEELSRAYPEGVVLEGSEVRKIDRGALPIRGPVIEAEGTLLPWTPNEYSRIWRAIATDIGISKSVRN